MKVPSVQERLLLVLVLVHLSQGIVYYYKPECVHRDRCCSNSHHIDPQSSQTQCRKDYVLCSKPCSRECGRNNWRPTSELISPRTQSWWDSVKLGEHPWQGAILEQRYSNSALQYLGGVSLIYPRWALTAADKVCGRIACRLYVRFGDVNLNSTDILFNHFQTSVDQMFFHPSFNYKTLSNNVALLRLRDPVPIGRYISPACLPSGIQGEDKKNCAVAGWGKTSFNSMYYSAELRAVDLSLISRQTCEQEMRRCNSTFRLDRSEMCAGGERGHDACIGDEGSPLVCSINGRYTQLGLVSKGVRCGTDAPGVYAKVDECWVEKTINDYQYRSFSQQRIEFPQA